MKTFTIGLTPIEEIRRAYQQLCPEGFKLSLTSDFATVMREVYDQGIDSHLEAITESPGVMLRGRLIIEATCNDLIVMLRRLQEMFESDTDLSEAALELRSAILEGLEIEEI